MRLDHLSYAVDRAGFASSVQRLGSALGQAFADGGVHPRFGTRNFVLPLREGIYVELVTPLDHPAADSTPYGRAVKQRAEMGGGWMGWVVGVDDIEPVAERLGRPAADGHRVRPDGFDLRWRQIGALDVLRDPQLPFFVQWLSDRRQHPSVGPSAVAVRRLEIAGDPATVSAYLGQPRDHPLDDVTVDWLEPDDSPGGQGPGLVAVHFSTPTGDVRID